MTEYKALVLCHNTKLTKNEKGNIEGHLKFDFTFSLIEKAYAEHKKITEYKFTYQTLDLNNCYPEFKIDELDEK